MFILSWPEVSLKDFIFENHSSDCPSLFGWLDLSPVDLFSFCWSFCLSFGYKKSYKLYTIWYFHHYRISSIGSSMTRIWVGSRISLEHSRKSFVIKNILYIAPCFASTGCRIHLFEYYWYFMVFRFIPLGISSAFSNLFFACPSFEQ